MIPEQKEECSTDLYSHARKAEQWYLQHCPSKWYQELFLRDFHHSRHRSIVRFDRITLRKAYATNR